jgi:hypothetical protein
MIISNLCRKCKNKFRRVFIPLKPEQYIDENGEQIFDNNEDNVVIMNMCLIANMDVEGEATVECDHYVLDDNSKCFSMLEHIDLNEF